jgi:serine/threonine-protein kinase
MNPSPSDWALLSALLDEALDLEDAAARSAWLARRAAERPALGSALAALLEAHAASGAADPLARVPALPGRETQVLALAAGERVGPYRLVREIGSGGMADVWLAERADGAFARKVALKLPHVDRSRRDLALRFARERDILARLEHPHIARLYDAGVAANGLPYLAMEYVDGRPIGEFCDARRLGIGARLRLFMQVLDAVRFAHAHLVIHRDLKPSNILVDALGAVRLLDFGIAKLLTGEGAARETQLTRLSGRALTLDYASPEQLKGEALTIASDVYSLGVVLYELLAGARPYRLRHASAAELEEAIANIDAPPASAAAQAPPDRRRLRGDIDAILNMALKKEPAERYGSVEAFAADIERHLRGEPVQARPDSLWYRASRLVLRRKLESAVIAAIAIALVVGAEAQAAVLFAIGAGAAVALWQARLARRQARRAREETARAEGVKRFVLAILEGAGVDRGGSRQTTAVELLELARERLDASGIDDDGTRVELLTALGTGLHGLGEPEQAAPLLAEAALLARERLGEPERRLVARARLAHAFVLLDRGDADAARAQFEAAEQIARRSGDGALLSAALRGQSELCSWTGQVERAIELARAAVHAALRAATSPGDRAAAIEAYVQLAGAMLEGERRGAIEPAERAYRLAREHDRDRPTRLLLRAQARYAAVLAEQGETAGALADLREVLRRQARMLGSDHLEVAGTWRQLGSAALRLGDTATSIESFRESLRICIAHSAERPSADLPGTRLNLGSALANAHRYAEALAEWREAEAGFAERQGADSEAARVARSGVGFALTRLGRLDEAEAVFANLLAHPFSGAMERVFIESRLGQLRSAQGRHAEALALLGAAPAFYADAPTQRPRALALGELGNALLAAARPAEALDALGEAQRLLRGIARDGSPDVADIALDIARAQLALGRHVEASAAASDAVAFWRGFAGGDAGLESALAVLAKAQRAPAESLPPDW